MKYSPNAIRFGSILSVICVATLIATAQEKKNWVRVKTGVDTIHVDETSLTFRPDASGYSADYRTTLAEPEPVPAKKGLNYAARIDKIEFGQGYRILSTKFLNHNGVVVHSLEFGDNAPWRQSFGDTAAAMSSVVRKLNPFGAWEVLEYRYATGEAGSPNDDKELRDLPGSRIQFEPSTASVGGSRYNISSLVGKTVSNADAKKYFDTSLAALGIEGDNLPAVRFTVTNGGEPSQSFLLRVNPERAIMLWEGVFLELRRVPSVFEP
jgi:hypothetical protein